MQTKTIFTAQRQHHPDGIQFRLVWARLQVSRVAAPIGVGQCVRRPLDGAGKFRVYEKRQTGPSNVGQSPSQLLLGDHGETIDPRMDQKALESTHARGGERFDIALIVVNHAAPRRPVDAASALRRRALGLKRSDGSCCRKTIQRHIDQQRESACRRGPGCCFETLPLGPPRIVDMNVGIDQSREDGGVAEIIRFVTIRYGMGGNDRLDPLSFDENGRGTDSLWQ